MAEFFESQSVAAFVERIAPKLAQEMGGRLMLGQVQCGAGQETWTIAAALTEAEIGHHIYAFDSNPDQLALTSAAYTLALTRAGPRALQTERPTLEELIGSNGYQPGCLQLFRSSRRSPGSIGPIPALRGRVTFKQGDFLFKPLFPEQHYGAVVLHDALGDYENAERTAILGNALAGLRDKGVLLLDNPDVMADRVYTQWLRAVPKKWELRPMPEATPFENAILRFRRNI